MIISFFTYALISYSRLTLEFKKSSFSGRITNFEFGERGSLNITLNNKKDYHLYDYAQVFYEVISIGDSINKTANSDRIILYKIDNNNKVIKSIANGHD